MLEIFVDDIKAFDPHQKAVRPTYCTIYEAGIKTHSQGGAVELLGEGF